MINLTQGNDPVRQGRTVHLGRGEEFAYTNTTDVPEDYSTWGWDERTRTFTPPQEYFEYVVERMDRGDDVEPVRSFNRYRGMQLLEAMRGHTGFGRFMSAGPNLSSEPSLDYRFARETIPTGTINTQYFSVNGESFIEAPFTAIRRRLFNAGLDEQLRRRFRSRGRSRFGTATTGLLKVTTVTWRAMWAVMCLPYNVGAFASDAARQLASTTYRRLGTDEEVKSKVRIHVRTKCKKCPKGQDQEPCGMLPHLERDDIVVDGDLVSYLRTYSAMRKRDRNLWVSLLSRCKTYQREYDVSDDCMAIIMPGSTMMAYLESEAETYALQLGNTIRHADTVRHFGSNAIVNGEYSGYLDALCRGGWGAVKDHWRKGSNVVVGAQ